MEEIIDKIQKLIKENKILKTENEILRKKLRERRNNHVRKNTKKIN